MQEIRPRHIRQHGKHLGLEAQSRAVEHLNRKHHGFTGANEALVVEQVEAGFGIV